MDTINVWYGSKYINDKGDFITVEADFNPENPRDYCGDMIRLYTWDWSYYGMTMSSPDDAPSMLDIIEPYYNPGWLDRKYNRYAEGEEYDTRYEWLFDLIESGTNPCRLPEFIVALNSKRGIRAWPLIKGYYGNDSHLDIDEDVSLSNMQYLERDNDLIGVAIVDMEKYRKYTSKRSGLFETVKAEVDEYAAWQVGSCHWVGIHSNQEDVEFVDLYGDVDGSVDLDMADFGDLTYVEFDEYEWWKMVEDIKRITFPYVGHISDERAKKALAALIEQHYSIPSFGDYGWTAMMKAITENAA